MTTPTQPAGPIQIRWFRNGYQSALADIAAAFERGGEEEAREYIANNLTKEGNR